VEGGHADRVEAQKILRHLQQDPALASLRDAAALDKLTAEGRAPFTQSWADVAAWLVQTQSVEGPK
jgi:hypothetical protein